VGQTPTANAVGGFYFLAHGKGKGRLSRNNRGRVIGRWAWDSECIFGRIPDGPRRETKRGLAPRRMRA
jgi:hypothetical protein